MSDSSPDPFDPLDELLTAYPAPPPLAPDFKAQVQQRLSAAPVAAPLRWWQSIDHVFGQPAFAAVFVCACVLLGLLLAEIRVGDERDRMHARVVESYLQLINPRIDAAATDAATTSGARATTEGHS